MNATESVSMLHSVVVAVDGPSKAGTTTIINRIGEAAASIDTPFSEALKSNLGTMVLGEPGLPEEVVADYAARHRLVSFDRVTVIPGGNFFRAAALHVIEREEQGKYDNSFSSEDADALHELLARPGIQDVLDHDSRIGTRVSGIIRNYAGAHALCGAMLCDAIVSSYAPGVGKLTVVDARNPENHLRAHDILGLMSGKVDPNSIVPIYIETPIAAAASRLPGDLEENARLIANRRRTDAERPDNPVTEPDTVEKSKFMWRMGFGNVPPAATAAPLLFENDQRVSFGDLDALAHDVAQTAREVGESLYARKLLYQMIDPRLNFLPGTKPADLLWVPGRP